MFSIIFFGVPFALLHIRIILTVSALVVAVVLQSTQLLQEAVNLYNSRVHELGHYTCSSVDMRLMPQVSFAGDAIATISKANIFKHMAKMENFYERIKATSHISDNHVFYPMLDRLLIALDN
ncbi:hypothetical protein LPJ59_001108 [Coemansia sp. RSA 2399]|nr:hypothetical protein LPJ59_001108 [Coemansia sp. RSA 2399]KAJ1907016.1 hypothetical protein LPJ81_001017 [Coemansia sp. IMI 209127]